LSNFILQGCTSGAATVAAARIFDSLAAIIDKSATASDATAAVAIAVVPVADAVEAITTEHLRNRMNHGEAGHGAMNPFFIREQDH